MENARLFYSCAYQRVRNVSSSEKFEYALNEWPLLKLHLFTCATTSNYYFGRFDINVRLLCIYNKSLFIPV